MSYFSDKDIKKALNKDIVIEPFDPACLTPIGYDFRIGDYVFSLEHGLLEIANGCYELPPKSTIQVLTKEALWVSSRVAGTFHSKVSLVSRGLSHISTT
jgi:deoxycytidine triphosphate deaminase